MGAVVFTYDMIGFGESVTYNHRNFKAVMIQDFNGLRVLNYLISQDYADKENVDESFVILQVVKDLKVFDRPIMF